MDKLIIIIIIMDKLIIIERKKNNSVESFFLLLHEHFDHEERYAHVLTKINYVRIPGNFDKKASNYSL